MSLWLLLLLLVPGLVRLMRMRIQRWSFPWRIRSTPTHLVIYREVSRVRRDASDYYFGRMDNRI